MQDQTDEPVPGRRTKTGSYAFAWALLAAAVALSTAALFLGWYERWHWFDEVIHAFSFFAATLLLSLYMYGDALTGYLRHRLVLMFAVLCVGLALGVFWEWGEWAYDHLSGKQNVIKGKADTLTDLIMDGLGALAAGLVMFGLLRRRPQ